ncbi:MAG: S9 family peptidase [Polyangiales bacterium]
MVRLTSDGQASTLTPHGFSARTLVYDYGGGAATSLGSTVYFSNYDAEAKDADQRIYRQAHDEIPVPITPPVALRYADPAAIPNSVWLIYVVEDSTAAGLTPSAEPTLSIAAIDREGRRSMRTLVAGADYYAAPRVSPDGRQLAWISWNKPHMPWDNSELWLAELDADCRLCPGSARRITAAGDRPLHEGESVFDPQWSPDGRFLYFVSDRSGYWRICRIPASGGAVEEVCGDPPSRAEFGRPQWHLGLSTYAFDADANIVCAYTQGGIWRLGHLDVQSGHLRVIPVQAPDGRVVTEIASVRVWQGRIVCVAGGPRQPACILSVDPATGQSHTLAISAPLQHADALSTPHSIQFPTFGGEPCQVQAFYYPPHNPTQKAAPNDKPPLVIRTHGGPTAAASTSIDLEIHYFTSRGFGVVDVNYRGSTGFGRAYRLSLYGQWGVFDRNDCVAAAEYLAAHPPGPAQSLLSPKVPGSEAPVPIDLRRVVARGVSAGGYLTLVQATYTRLLRAGASYSGISDIVRLYAQTHKFEKYYIVELMGVWPVDPDAPPERRNFVQTYAMRSPSHVAGLIQTPMIFFQGKGDKIVPPDQTQGIVRALQQRGVPVAQFLFADEQHGLRIAKNIVTALDAELYFYGQMLGFVPAGNLPHVPIDNWD